MGSGPYIIICDAETSLLMTSDPRERIRIATGMAASLSSLLDCKGLLTLEDSQPFSDVMHHLEHSLPQVTKEDADAAVKAIIDHAEVLREKYEIADDS